MQKAWLGRVTVRQALGASAAKWNQLKSAYKKK
jgi:hypothetical protein